MMRGFCLDLACNHATRAATPPIRHAPNLVRSSLQTLPPVEKHIAIRCFSTTQIDVARAFGIDEGTVRNIFREYD